MNDQESRVILVNFQDCEVGTMEKTEAHRKAKLHRAFSVFLYHGDQILLQQRARNKYHCGLKWTNTCCSHPLPGEDTCRAAIKRLEDEVGIVIEELYEIFSFFYFSQLDHEMTEFECDHVFVAEYTGPFQKNPDEVEDMKWISCQQLERDMMAEPENFTPWFLICAPEVIKYITGTASRTL